MTTQPDWIAEAAAEIASLFETGPEQSIASLIEKHCPFKRDVAYVEAQQERDEVASIVLDLEAQYRDIAKGYLSPAEGKRRRVTLAVQVENVADSLKELAYEISGHEMKA